MSRHNRDKAPAGDPGPRQIPMRLPVHASRAREDFFVAPSNSLAFETVRAWRDWPGGKLVLEGAPGAGKSHLARLWAGEAGARVLEVEELETLEPGALRGARVAVEDAAAVAGRRHLEEALFHLHNAVLSEAEGRLLLSARGPVRDWGLTLPDLASRLNACAHVRIEDPDETLLSMVLVKLFSDRQVQVSPALISYLATRMERSLGEAARLVERLDRAALAERRPITRALAARVLDFAAQEDR